VQFLKKKKNAKNENKFQRKEEIHCDWVW
jgi:hypothetical protein